MPNENRPRLTRRELLAGTALGLGAITLARKLYSSSDKKEQGYELADDFSPEISHIAVNNLDKIPNAGYGSIRLSTGRPNNDSSYGPILAGDRYGQIPYERMLSLVDFNRGIKIEKTEVADTDVNLFSSPTILPGDQATFAYRVYEGNNYGFSPLKKGTYTIIWGAEPLGGSFPKSDGSEERYDSSLGVVGVSKTYPSEDNTLYLVVFQKQGEVAITSLNGKPVPPLPKDYTPFEAFKLTTDKPAKPRL